jgi:hypothetical protein
LIQRCAPEPDTCIARVSLRLGIPLGALATALVMVTGHFSAEHVARFQPMSSQPSKACGSTRQVPPGGSPQGIREELAKQEDRIREAISTWPLAPRSGSLSGYREIYDRELAHAEGIRSQADLVHRGAQLPALEHGVFATVLVTSSVYLACLSVRAAVAAPDPAWPRRAADRLLLVAPALRPRRRSHSSADCLNPPPRRAARARRQSRSVMSLFGNAR